MARMDLGDVTIRYEDFGQGPRALVFCQSDHPMREPMGQFLLPEMERLAPVFGRTVIWEYRAMGESSIPQKLNMPLAASDLARLIDGLGITEPIVYGFEWGGFLVQQFTLDYPGKAPVLILDSTSSEVNIPVSEQYYQGAERVKQNPEAPDRDFHIFASRAVAGLREHPYTPRLKEIKTPTLILHASQDRSTRGAAPAVIMSRNLPNAELKIFESEGHGMIHERPQEVQDLVVEFCRKHGVL